MKDEKIIRTTLSWLPSVMISIIFIQNGIGKIFLSNQMDKIISDNTIIIIIGVFLLIATALFLYNRTIILGASLLAAYMICIVFIHMYKGKPFEVAILIIISTIFAAYLRKPQILHQKQ